MSYIIYHNPRCQKSRQTLKLLQNHKIEPKVIEYLKSPFTSTQLQDVLSKLKLKPSQLIRRKEDLVKKLKLDLENEKQILTAMIEHPELIERPIVILGDKGVLGRPPENVCALFKQQSRG
jgi:arsenate reductase